MNYDYPVHKQSSVVEQLRSPALYDALVLDANLRQSLVTVRSLGQRNLRVAALDVVSMQEKMKYFPAFASRWCQQQYMAPAFEQSTGPFVTYLLSLIEQTGAKVIITSSDGTLAALREHRQEIEQKVRLTLAKESALDAAINKDLTLSIAERLGLNIPQGVVVRSIDEVAEAVKTIGLPAVIKPIESWLWGKEHGVRLVCKLVTTLDEARVAIEELTQYGGSVLVQQFLSGRREAVSLLYAQGEIYARFAQWAKRMQPPLGGTSVYRQSIALPDDITDHAERLVREIELEGYSEVEFRRDSAGKPYLMEINPRLSASVEVAVRAGVDFPYLLYQWAQGVRLEYVQGYRTGKWMRYLEGDLLTTFQALQERGRPGVTPPVQALFEFAAAFVVPTGYDYLDVRDPLPAWYAFMDFNYRLGKKVQKKFIRS